MQVVHDFKLGKEGIRILLDRCPNYTSFIFTANFQTECTVSIRWMGNMLNNTWGYHTIHIIMVCTGSVLKKLALEAELDNCILARSESSWQLALQVVCWWLQPWADILMLQTLELFQEKSARPGGRQLKFCCLTKGGLPLLGYNQEPYSGAAPPPLGGGGLSTH